MNISPKLKSLLATLRDCVRVSEPGGACASVVQEIVSVVPQFENAQTTAGFFVTKAGDIIDDHWWIVMPDGSIFDPTQDQFGDDGFGDIVRISPSERKYKHYFEYTSSAGIPIEVVDLANKITAKKRVSKNKSLSEMISEVSGASPSSDVARQSGGLEDSSLIYDEPDEEYTPEEFESLLRQMQLDHNGSPTEGGHIEEDIDQRSLSEARGPNMGDLEDGRMAQYIVWQASERVREAMAQDEEYLWPFLEKFTGDYTMGLEDLDDEQRAEFDEWLDKAISDETHDAYVRVVHTLKGGPNGGIMLYRYIVAAPDLPNHFDARDVGIYWSNNPDEANAWGAIEKEGHVEWLIVAEASADSINWVETIFQNTIEPHEGEIQVKKGSPLNILDLRPQTSPESAYGDEGMPNQAAVNKQYQQFKYEPRVLNASIGEAIDSRSLVNVYTPEFKSWFKNSKAVDGDGSPIVFFRGARRVPKSDRFGTLGGRATPSFVASADIASVYAATRSSFGVDYKPGAAVYPVFLSIQNPVDLRDDFEINLEYDLFSLLNSDWDNEQEFEYVLGIIEELWNFEDRGIPFKYELPTGYLGNMDWEDLISNLRKYYAKDDLDSVTTLLGMTYVDIFAIIDTKSFTNWAREKGFDGVVHVDVFDVGAQYASELLGKESASGLDEENQHTTWRPFYPAQVKSIFNVGKWSSEKGSPMTENSGKEILSDVKTYSPEFLAKKHNVPLEQIEDELKKGIKIEFEHTQSRQLSREIALDHLLELPDYYTRLIKMEESVDFYSSADEQYNYPNPLPLADEEIFSFVYDTYDEIIYDPKFKKAHGFEIDDIDIQDIIGTEKFLNQEHLNSGGISQKPPVLAKLGSKYYVYDGNHRVVRALLDGKSHIKSQIMDLEKWSALINEDIWSGLSQQSAETMPRDELMASLHPDDKRFMALLNKEPSEQAYLDNLQQSVATSGIKNPIQLIILPDGKIRVPDGNHRIIVANRLGMTDIPYVIDKDLRDTINEDVVSKTNIIPSTYKGKYLFHDTDKQSAESIVKNDYFRVQKGWSVTGLSTHYKPEGEYHKRGVRFVLDRTKLEKDFELVQVEEPIGFDEYEIKVVSDSPITNASKYIIDVFDTDNIKEVDHPDYMPGGESGSDGHDPTYDERFSQYNTGSPAP